MKLSVQPFISLSVLEKAWWSAAVLLLWNIPTPPWCDSENLARDKASKIIAKNIQLSFWWAMCAEKAKEMAKGGKTHQCSCPLVQADVLQTCRFWQGDFVCNLADICEFSLCSFSTYLDSGGTVSSTCLLHIGVPLSGVPSILSSLGTFECVLIVVVFTTSILFSNPGNLQGAFWL